MPSLDKFVERMCYWCDTTAGGGLGYDQSNRWDIRPGGEADCSSLVIHCLKEAGFNTGSATYTGNMRANLVKNGWVVITPNGAPKVGDILLNDVHHVAVCTAPGYMSYASIDERGKASGGKAGDQTGAETKTVKGFYYSRGWDCYLRYGNAQTSTTAKPATSSPVKDVQRWLNQNFGAALGLDGVFGAKTKAALCRALQMHLNTQYGAHLTIDGVMGAKTKAACPNLKTGSSGNGVRLLQGALICRGYSTNGFDGMFGNGTKSAVMSWQRKNGLVVDGIAGKNTFYSLFK